MSDRLLTIGIPTYQNHQQLAWCLSSLFRHHMFPFKAVVVNNDPSVGGEIMIDSMIKQLGTPYIEAIHPGQNLGWEGGVNAALDRADTPYFVMLNDDVVFPVGRPEFFRVMAEYFHHPDIGAVGPCSNFAMGVQGLMNLTVDMLVETTLLIGFCMMVKTDVFRDMGGLDTHLPGGDDLDLSIRLRDKGLRLICDRRLYVHHIGQQTGARLYPGEWNSPQMSDNTNNAIIHKHGVTKWYHTFQAQWQAYAPAGVLPSSHQERELVWRNEQVSKRQHLKGFNLGCGQNSEKAKWGMDKFKRGDQLEATFHDVKVDCAVVGDALHLPAKEGSLDFLVAIHLFEHLIDPIGALSEWSKSLKPNGEIVLVIPNQRLLDTILINHTHVHAYVPETIKGMLQVTNWDIVEEVFFPRTGTMGIIGRKRG